MAMNRLTEYKCETAKQGRHGDGLGLYLQVRGPLAKAWLYRYKDVSGKERFMGLGSYPVISLDAARDRVLALRRKRGEGIDPLDDKRAHQAAQKALAMKRKTFRECAERVIEIKKPEWANAKHAQQWENTLATYAYPTIGDLDISMIDSHHVVGVLRPIWTAKPETARRLQQRLAAVLNWAIASRLRAEPNPARMVGNLDAMLSSHKEIRRKNPEKAVRNHPALPYAEIHEFIQQVREREATAARCLEFTILTCVRTANSIGVEWSEIDSERALWTIPASKMKGKREHVIPLSKQALAIIEGQRGKDDVYVFPSAINRPLSNMSMLQLLGRMKRDDLTVHGFRSTFRDWVGEETIFDGDAAELVLAHTIDSKTEAAYRRGDMLKKRRQMMAAWADYIDTKPHVASVTRLRSQADER